MNPRWWLSSWSILLFVAAVVSIVDQLSKSIVSEVLGPGSDRGPVSVISGFLEFRYVENTGAAFGILQDSTTLLVFVSFGVIALLALVFWGMIGRSLLLGAAFGFQFGGAVGNLIDRVRLGYVVDFVDVPLIPVFNVADSGITVGVVILAFVLLFRPEETMVSGDESARVQDNDVMIDSDNDEAADQTDLDHDHTGSSISRDSGV